MPQQLDPLRQRRIVAWSRSSECEGLRLDSHGEVAEQGGYVIAHPHVVTPIVNLGREDLYPESRFHRVVEDAPIRKPNVVAKVERVMAHGLVASRYAMDKAGGGRQRQPRNAGPCRE